MSGYHHAYNARGRQFGDPVFWGSLVKKGPRKPHRHKISHGYWELNPNANPEQKWTKWRWVHAPEHTAPHVPPGADDLLPDDILTDVVGIFNPQPNPGGFAPQSPSFNPMWLAAAALAFLMIKRK